jgi:hypothetical protein
VLDYGLVESAAFVSIELEVAGEVDIAMAKADAAAVYIDQTGHIQGTVGCTAAGTAHSL